MEASEEADAIEGSSRSLNSQDGYSWSCSAMGSALSLKMDTPLRTVPGGAADGRDGVSAGALEEDGEADEDAVAEADAYERESGACRKEEHEARAVLVAALNMVARFESYGVEDLCDLV